MNTVSSLSHKGLALAAALTFAFSLFPPVPATVQATGTTFTVNSTADLTDVDTGIPTCIASNNACTLRAAIVQANYTPGADTIILPAGVYKLDRPGEDDTGIIGDLDITDDLTIQGAGSGVTIVDGNGTVTGDRVFQILATAKNVTLRGLTIRNGKRTASFDEGGGLLWNGGGGSQLTLSEVAVVNNTSTYYGGLALIYSQNGDTVDLDHLVVSGNSATAAVGGLGAEFGDFAVFDLRDSQIYNNKAHQGGGLYFDQYSNLPNGVRSAKLETTAVYNNNASLSGGIENHIGYQSTPMEMENDLVYNNHADFYGGGIGNLGSLVMTETTVDSNTAAIRGGGLYNYEGGNFDIRQSTLSRNTAQTGGGGYNEFFIHNLAQMIFTNSTITANTASQDGGAIYADGGQAKFFNTTLANNDVKVPSGTVYAGTGGGIYANPRAEFLSLNTVLANNTHQYLPAPPIEDDCVGTVASVGYNLFKEVESACTIIWVTTGNITGLDPLLGSLQNNGGPTQTLYPRPGSPLINSGELPDCTDVNNAVIPIDQRGVARPFASRCDIGAVERTPFGLYLPTISN